MEKNKLEKNGLPQGYWVIKSGDELQCGYYENGNRVGIWRNYRDDFLSNTYIVGEPYWDVYYQDEIVEYFTGSEDIHYHYNE